MVIECSCGKIMCGICNPKGGCRECKTAMPLKWLDESGLCPACAFMKELEEKLRGGDKNE